MWKYSQYYLHSIKMTVCNYEFYPFVHVVIKRIQQNYLNFFKRIDFSIKENKIICQFGT